MSWLLPDTTIAMIVRDEEANPAGGIRKFCETMLPFIPRAHIVDTGSQDATLDILQEMQDSYPGVRISQAEFEGFAEARNVSLEGIDTKYVLVPDADEIILPEDIAKIANLILAHPQVSFWELDNIEVWEKMYWGTGINPKLFQRDATKGFVNSSRFPGADETLIEISPQRYSRAAADRNMCRSGIKIYHFMPGGISGDNKQYVKDNYYTELTRAAKRGEPLPNPRDNPNFEKWKVLNPFSDKAKLNDLIENTKIGHRY